MSISTITTLTTSAATSLISGPTWAPESAFDVITATLLSGTVLPNTTCAGPASPTHGTWLSPDDSVTLEPLNQTTLDYALACCKNAGIYYFIDPQCSDQISGSGLFCQPVGQTLTQLDLCLKNGTEPVNGIGRLYCHGEDEQCDQTASIQNVSIAITTTVSNTASETTSGSISTASEPSTIATAASTTTGPMVSQAAAPVLVPHGDGAVGASKVVVTLCVVWLVGLFAGAVAM